MPADQLTAAEIETAIAHVISGAPVTAAATAIGMHPAELADAVEVYRQAGRHALQRAAPGWWQVYIRFTDWERAEHTAAGHLAPLLQQAEAEAVIGGWWFMRKHPCWRLRLRPGPAGHTMTSDLAAALDQLTTKGQLDGWWPGIYEAETAAFGGNPGMDIAHNLFCDDSRAILTMLSNNEHGDEPPLGRRELTLLLCGTLMRAAHLEWYEQGDVWHRITQERPLPTGIPTAKIAAMAAEVKSLLLTDTTPDGPLLGANGPLAGAADWVAAFRRTGQALGIATREGTLQRGLREIITYLVIFHWNRLGLHLRTQSVLASAARAAVLQMPAVLPHASEKGAPRAAIPPDPAELAGSAEERSVATS